jgi:high-affinity iron transporter
VLTSFLISFRESLEAALIVGILLGYLLRTKQQRYNNLVYLSIAAGITASIAFAFAFNYLAGGFAGAPEQVFEGTTMILAAVLLTFMILWMMKQRHIALHMHRRMQEKIDAGKTFGLFMIGFVAIIREGVETFIFLDAARFAGGPTSTLGAFLGVFAAILLGYLVFIGTMKIGVKKFFNVTSLLLIFFAAGLAAQGTHEFQEAGMLPLLENQAWDIGHVLSTGSYFGSVMKGLFGYNSSPSVLEVIAYASYFGFVYLLYRRIESISASAAQKS